ncbi:hypothetical protein PoB_002526700 [Plakobranchus ocellatus]|uniref:Uncharacterized protein n=1 Tax=Plakobranchus ocellatus TaxID=259542 RepID=A0AAV3ZUI8_9GAST|nr:hypothetical protein PoB_002526700 [Plakobranchus ocellatus]
MISGVMMTMTMKMMRKGEIRRGSLSGCKLRGNSLPTSETKIMMGTWTRTRSVNGSSLRTMTTAQPRLHISCDRQMKTGLVQGKSFGCCAWDSS